MKSERRTLPCEDTLLAAQCLAKGHALVTDKAKHFELLRPLGWVVENPLVSIACRDADHFPHSQTPFTFCESGNSDPIRRYDGSEKFVKLVESNRLQIQKDFWCLRC